MYSKDINTFRRLFLFHDWAYNAVCDLDPDGNLHNIMQHCQKPCGHACDSDKKSWFLQVYMNHFGEKPDRNIWSLLLPCHDTCSEEASNLFADIYQVDAERQD
jgi:hypothetical protein